MAREAGVPIVASVGYTADELALLGEELEKAGVADAVEFSIHYVGKDPQTLRSLARALKSSRQHPGAGQAQSRGCGPPGGDRHPGGTCRRLRGGQQRRPRPGLRPRDRAPAPGQPGRARLALRWGHSARGSALRGRDQRPDRQTRDRGRRGAAGVDVVKYLMAGASAVQVCSLAVLKGQEVYGKLARELSEWMDARGYTSVTELQGGTLGLWPSGNTTPRRASPAADRERPPRLFPRIDPDACTLCRLCERSCIHGAIRFEDRRVSARPRPAACSAACAAPCARWTPLPWSPRTSEQR